MADPATSQDATQNSNQSDKTSSISDIQKRISNELVIGLCGAIGSGIKPLKDQLRKELENNKYIVIDVRLSELISANYKQFITDSATVESIAPLEGSQRIKDLQNKGNSFREQHRNEVLAELAIKEISSRRNTKILQNPDEHSESDTEENKTLTKVAYLVDQLKHPDEVKLFKTVYPKNFYLISLIRTEKERRLNLEEDGYSTSDIDEIIRNDRKQNEKYGQQVEKTVHLADYFIRNMHSHAENLNAEIRRFLKLVHGVQGLSPRREERGMYAAYSASLQSACLSRQVGAAIADEDGIIFSTGRNDVPEFGGGLYSFESGTADYRCVHKGKKCYNDFYKESLRKEIQQVLEQQKVKDASNISKAILADTKAGALIEYSRAIHAEMDAITTLARKDNSSTKGKILYCTTYPCHNCARHIVAAGIQKVVYIEPYEKSLALKLHNDSITDSDEKNKVVFEPYEGVSPQRYMAFFTMIRPRKGRDGKAIDSYIEETQHVDPQYLDNYHAYEDKIIKNLEF
ncbi:anti-phage dCTP deaminase [Neptuniibacter sp. QD48_11]|uniref:anti-phage dCTP deaminase n=1 Tax=Neptuniibacter sp. QD48_11 TaxID=3398211 RepID=UPI0039F58107